MKRMIGLLLALLMMLSLCACGGTGADNEMAAEPETPETEATAQQLQKISEDITLLSCRFADSVHAIDDEFIGSLYEKIQGRIYVDMVFSVDNNSGEDFGPDQISGRLTYQEEEWELHYCRESATSVGVNDNPVGDEFALVHLFTRLPAEAEQEDLTVTYTVNGEEYTCKVAPKQTTEGLDRKTEVRQGDVISLLDGDYAFEVLEVGIIENLQASYQTDDYYIGPFAIVKLNVTNNHPGRTLYDIQGYTKLDNEWMRISVDIEGGEFTDFEGLDYYGVAPGESRLVYIYFGIDEDEISDDLMIRFNLCGSCYYAKIQ